MRTRRVTPEEYQANLARIEERVGRNRTLLPNPAHIVWCWLAVLLFILPMWH
jgi:hypothetical protein